MLAYAANRPRSVERKSSPHAMLAIIAGHVALIAAVMSARMDLPQKLTRPPLTIDLIEEDDPPPPHAPDVRAKTPEPRSVIDRPPAVVPVPAPPAPFVDDRPAPVPDVGAVPGPNVVPQPRIEPTPIPAPPRVAARLITSGAELRPPYPASKLSSGEEAVLRLRLTIDERGRVVGVDAMGPADRAFLDAARRHLLAHWRYRPASEGGRSVASTAVITLRFQLEG